MDRRVYVLVRGRVQNVGFRIWTLARARQLGLSGWVRNLADGRLVEIEAEGDEHQIARLVAALHHGPAGARVDTVEVQERSPVGDQHGGFRVR